MHIGKLGVDATWGQASDAIKRYCLECKLKEVVVCLGHYYPPTRKQLEEYTQTKGWLFEHQVNREVKECKWVYRPNASRQLEMVMDVNRLKTFLHSRLATPPGAPGCISLFNALPEVHNLFSNHVCNSEYPESVRVIGRNITKDLWQERIGRPDNDWLDCLVGCVALCSRQGAAIRSGTKERKARPKKKRRSLSDVYAQRQRDR